VFHQPESPAEDAARDGAPACPAGAISFAH
jgi:hypothetical protein